MAISRGQYGMGSQITEEYFFVGAYRPEGGCYTDLVAAITRKIAFAMMAKKYPGCRIELEVCPKERYMEEMAQSAYWAKHCGGARGPEPIC